MNTISDFNRIRLNSIINKINLFKNKEIDLFDLINFIDTLYRSLVCWDPKWSDEFFQNWLDLESIYAGIKNNNNLDLSIEELNIINNAIQRLNELVSIALNRYIKTPDPIITKTATQLDGMWLLCPYCIDAWECFSEDAMVICPKCDKALHNPRWKLPQENK